MMIAATGSQALWYLTRGTGAVTLILLTASVVLGIVNVRRWRPQAWPRFVLDALHQNVSLAVLVLVVVHVLTSLLDGYAPIAVLDAVIPFVGTYRPLWLGLGALALDLLVALTLTSLLRRRIGQRAWRAIHWAAYACWPLALVHSLGTGTDTPISWMLALTVACVLAVIAAAATRVSTGWPEHRDIRLTAMAALILGPVLLIVWLPGGPLGKGWARRAGTPTRLLASRAANAPPAASAPARGNAPADASLSGPFNAELSGSVRQGPTAGNGVAVDLNMSLSGPGSRRLEVLIHGPPVPGGGVQMTSSNVTLGTGARSDIYRGELQSLQGNQLVAQVARGDGHALELRITVSVDPGGTSVTGTVVARPRPGRA
jgi:DMSO/TMAO reductase YedYZ heme-binding membrane subunit